MSSPTHAELEGRKLGLLLSTSPDTPGFQHALKLALAAVDARVQVYMYCIDDAVPGISDPLLQSLRQRGLRLFACAYGAQRREIPTSDLAVFAGLATLGDLIANTDRFLSFN